MRLTSPPMMLLMAVLTTAGCDSSKGAAPGANSGTTAPDKTLEAGDAAPDVEMTLHTGDKVKLSSLRGSKVLLWFYPKDDTPGCTTEGQGLRDDFEKLTAAGVKIYGVSMQDTTSHQAFIDKHQFQYPLVADDGTIAAAFNVPVKLGFAARQSFLIGGDGKLIKVWRSVTPADHSDEVLAAASE